MEVKYMDERFDEIQKMIVWNKAQKCEGKSGLMYRLDDCGAWIKFTEYKNEKSDFGWEIDHIYPQKKLEDVGVPLELIDNIENLRALNIHNNRSKQDQYPMHTFKMKALSNKIVNNVECKDEIKVSILKQFKLSQLYKKYLNKN